MSKKLSKQESLAGKILIDLNLELGDKVFRSLVEGMGVVIEEPKKTHTFELDKKIVNELYSEDLAKRGLELLNGLTQVATALKEREDFSPLAQRSIAYSIETLEYYFTII